MDSQVLSAISEEDEVSSVVLVQVQSELEADVAIPLSIIRVHDGTRGRGSRVT